MTRTDVLVDALSYIKRFKGHIFVVKIGSEVTSKKEVLEGVSEDLMLLDFLDIHPVVVHGGGVEITQEMSKQGKKPKFLKGLRITDKETMDIVKKVLNKINKRIVSSINHKGAKAMEIPDGTLFQVEKQKAAVDLGYVGEIQKINTKAIKAKIRQRQIPVVSPLGQTIDNLTYNINADTAAAELAAALKASKIILMTNVRGVLNPHGSLIKTLSINEAKKLIKNKTASGGMIPKLKACTHALSKSVQSAHIIKAGGHILLEEILTTEGTGTMINK